MKRRPGRGDKETKEQRDLVRLKVQLQKCRSEQARQERGTTLRRTLSVSRWWLVLCIMMLAVSGCARKTRVVSPAGRLTAAKTEIIYECYGGPQQYTAWKKYVEAFTAANPDIHVELRLVTGQDNRTKYQTEMAAGVGADVMDLQDDYLQEFAKRGLLMDLTQKIKRAGIDKSQYFPGAFETFSYEGRTYGVPYGGGAEVLFYNKKLFDTARAPYPTKDWTYEDFLAAAKKLTLDLDHNGSIEQYGCLLNPHMNNLAPFLWAFGGEITDKAVTRSLLDGPGAVAGIQFWADLVTKHRVAPTLGVMGGGGADLFVAGRVAMMFGGPWFVATFKEAPELAWDLQHRPIGPTGKRVTRSTFDGLVVNAKAKQPEAAWRFAAFSLTPRGAEAMGESGRGLPSLIKAAKGPVYADPKAPQKLAVFAEAMSYGRNWPQPPQINELNRDTKTVLERLLAQKIDGKQAGKELAEAWNRDLRSP